MKNVIIVILLMCLVLLSFYSFIQKQESEKHKNELSIYIKGDKIVSNEYIENMNFLKENSSDSLIIDSLWKNSMFLKNYMKNLEKFENE